MADRLQTLASDCDRTRSRHTPRAKVDTQIDLATNEASRVLAPAMLAIHRRRAGVARSWWKTYYGVSSCDIAPIEVIQLAPVARPCPLPDQGPGRRGRWHLNVAPALHQQR